MERVKLFVRTFDYCQTVILQTWPQSQSNQWFIIVLPLSVCALAMMWMAVWSWKKHIHLIYCQAVNFFPPRESHKHNKTPPTQSHEPLPRSREWILLCRLISLHWFPAFPPCLHRFSLRGSFCWLMAWKPTGGKQSTHHQTMLLL